MRFFRFALRWGLPPLLAVGGFAIGYVVFFPGLASSRLSDGSEASFHQTASKISEGNLLEKASPLERVAWLLEVCKQPRSLHRDAALFETIQRLQPGDFMAAVTDVSELSKWFSSMDDKLRADVIEAVVERWMEVDEEGLLRWLPIAQRIVDSGALKLPQMSAADLGAIYSVVARRNPAWAFEQLKSLGAKMRPPVAIEALMRSAVESGSPQAERWLASFKDGPHYKRALKAYINALAPMDPERALNKAREEEPQDRSLPIQILTSAASRSPVLATSLLDKLSEQGRKDVILSTFPIILGLDRNFDAFGWLDAEISKDPRIFKVDQDRSVKYSLAMGIALRDGAKSMEWLQKFEEPRRAALAEAVAATWSGQDPKAVLEWLISHPQQSVPLKSSTLDGLAKSNPELFAKWMAGMSGGDRRLQAQSTAASQFLGRGRMEEAVGTFPKEGTSNQLLDSAQQFGFGVASMDVNRATTWLGNLQSAPLQLRATQGVLERWMMTSPANAAAWAGSLPPGHLRDSAAGLIATTIAERDFEGASAWLSEVKGEGVRNRFIEEVYKKRYSQNAAQAVTWLRSLPDMSETTRNRLLETHP